MAKKNKSQKRKMKRAPTVLLGEEVAAAELTAPDSQLSRLLQGIHYFPFIFGVLFSTGFQISETDSFLAASLFLLALREGNYRAAKQGVRDPGSIGFLTGACILSVYTSAVSPNALQPLFAIPIIFTSNFRAVRPIQLPRDVVLHATLQVLEMSLLVYFGVATQSVDTIWSLGIVGYLPASYLAGAYVAKYSKFLTSRGLERMVLKQKGDDQIPWPGAQTRIFTTFVVILPGIILMLIPLRLVPVELLLIAVLFYPALAVSQQFQDAAAIDEQLIRKTEKIALYATAVLVLVAIATRV